MRKIDKIKFVLLDWCYYFWREWIYPAYSWRNMLFNRYDLIRLKEIKSTQYSDVSYRMKCAVYTLVHEFLTREKLQHVFWHKDYEGNDVGPKYHFNHHKPIYPEYEGIYIMDILKEIEEWNLKGRKQFEDKLQDFYEYVDNLYDVQKNKQMIKSLEELHNHFQFAVPYLKKYVNEVECSDWLDHKKVFKGLELMESERDQKDLKYMILAVEIYEWLWI